MSKTISVRIDDSTYAAVTDAAGACGLSMGDWLKLCIEYCLNTDGERKQDDDTTANIIDVERIQPVYVTEESKHVNPAVEASHLSNAELQKKWGFLIRDGKFTGSASEYESYLADAADLGL